MSRAAAPHLFGMTPVELVEHLRAAGCGVDDDEARRLLAHVISQGEMDLSPRHSVRRQVRQAVAATTLRSRPEVLERAADPGDGFVKYLLRMPDGAQAEAVRIPLHRPGRFTVCLSSQVGCAMGCAYCATGQLGLTRHLAAWEMVASFVVVRDEAPGQVRGAVFMGQGEPLHNYDQVLQAARVLSHSCGGRIRREAITIGSVGLVPQIRRYTREGHRYRLMVSLASALPARRAALCPGAARYSLEELGAALRDHGHTNERRLALAWVVLGGVNTGADEVSALRSLVGDVPLRLSLVQVNDGVPRGFRRADSVELEAFVDALQVLRAPIVRRYSGGERHGACGTLRGARLTPRG